MKPKDVNYTNDNFIFYIIHLRTYVSDTSFVKWKKIARIVFDNLASKVSLV